MKLGFHISIAGGIECSLERAKKLGCDCMQVFSRNPRGWNFTPLTNESIALFKRARYAVGISPVAIHLPYLPNLASPNNKLYEKSIESLTEEIRRAKILDCDFVVTHVGKAIDAPVNEVLKKVATAIDISVQHVHPRSVRILLENTAGQGSEVGWSFKSLAEILALSGCSDKLGICLDTAHAFAAGYEVSNKSGLDKTLREFDRVIGMEKLHLLHLNDSRCELGGRIDRHENIGEGKIGKNGFKLIINHTLLNGIPGIMETPVRKKRDDIKNMKIMRSLVLSDRNTPKR